MPPLRLPVPKKLVTKNPSLEAPSTLEQFKLFFEDIPHKHFPRRRLSRKSSSKKIILKHEKPL
jgi:hypothetical protein